MSGIVSGFAVADSVGLLARRICTARPSRPKEQGSGSRGISPALQSRGGDGFSPSSRHGVYGYCGETQRHWHGQGAALLRVNVLAEPLNRHSPRNKIFSAFPPISCQKSGLHHVAPTFRWALHKLNRHDYEISSPRRARKFTRGLPAGPSSTSSGASNTCSSNSF